MKIVIIGGGAAGFFAAITCAEANPSAQVILLEKGREVLQKVKVSGGGRCNVTHACFDPKELVNNYPRGEKALLGPFHRFQPADTVQWFEQRGVQLKAESDGRMFPVTDDSQTIIDCLMKTVTAARVNILTGQNVQTLQSPTTENPDWKITTQAGSVYSAGKLMIATGSSPRVWDMIKALGHQIIQPVPSLFTFNIKDVRIKGLLGLSVPQAQVKVSGTSLAAVGPLLITHWGMSGPAILRLSAWGARVFADKKYKFDIEVSWNGQSFSSTSSELHIFKGAHAKKVVDANSLFEIPMRLWKSLCLAAGIGEGSRWADLSKDKIESLATEITSGIYQVNGKSTFKEEFVTAGGVHLDEVDFRTFQSKLVKNLFFAGEILDIDAITGGFNFQAAWTGAYLAGLEMAREI